LVEFVFAFCVLLREALVPLADADVLDDAAPVSHSYHFVVGEFLLDFIDLLLAVYFLECVSVHIAAPVFVLVQAEQPLVLRAHAFDHLRQVFGRVERLEQVLEGRVVQVFLQVDHGEDVFDRGLLGPGDLLLLVLQALLLE